MKVTGISIKNGWPIIATETKVLFWKKKRSFLATRKIVEDYFGWVELPNNLIVPDPLSLQLDEWLRISRAAGNPKATLEPP